MKDHSRLTFLFENVPYLISRMWCDFFFTMFLIIQSVENKCCADFQMYFSGLEGFSRRRREFFRKYFQYISPMQVVANIPRKITLFRQNLNDNLFSRGLPCSQYSWMSFALPPLQPQYNLAKQLMSWARHLHPPASKHIAEAGPEEEYL